jgi:hypothetical protein
MYLAALPKEMLNKLPVLETKGADVSVRLKDERSAREVAKQIEGWFEKLPANVTSTASG